MSAHSTERRGVRTPNSPRRSLWIHTLYAAVVITAIGITSSTLNAQATVGTYGLGTGWATFGVPLPQGAARDLKLGALATQVDVKTRYSDGSIRFAIVSANVPSAGTYNLVAGTSTTGSAYSPTWPSVSVQMRMVPSGTVYTATLPAANTTDAWLAGPLVREARVRVTPTSGGTAHPFLRVLFDVRSFSDGSHRVDVIGENTLVQNASTDRVDYELTVTVNGSVTYSRGSQSGGGTLSSSDLTQVATTGPHGLSKGELVELTSGPQAGQVRMVSSVYNSNTFYVSWPWSAAQSGATWRRLAIRHWAGSRWRKTFGVGYSEASVRNDTTNLVKSNAVPEYLSSLATDASYPERGPNPYEPMNIGVVMVPGNSAGGRPEIGPYPQWTARYIAHPTPDLKAVVVGEGNSAGSFPIHWSDSDTKQLISLTDRPTFWRSWGNGGKGMGKSDDGAVDHFQVDTPHIASLAVVPYLLTGDRYFLDEMKFWANWSLLGTYTQGLPAGASSRGDSVGYLGQSFNAARGWGWGLRNLTDAAVWAPDSDPYKSYLTTILLNNLRIADTYANAQGSSPWEGFVDSFDGYSPHWPEYGDSYPKYGVTSLWQVCYLGWAVDHAMGLGYSDGAAIRSKIARLVMNIYNSPGVAPTERAPYRLFIGIIPTRGATPTYYPTVDAAYVAMRADPGASSLLPPYLGDYYGTEVRLIYQIAAKIGLANASNALSWIEGSVDPAGNWFSDRVNLRSQFGTASTPGQALRNHNVKMSPPSGIKVIK